MDSEILRGQCACLQLFEASKGLGGSRSHDASKEGHTVLTMHVLPSGVKATDQSNNWPVFSCLHGSAWPHEYTWWAVEAKRKPV